MTASLTTLQLAQRIADAVLAVRSAQRWRVEPSRDAPTQAVLKVLHENDSWFCRCDEDESGVTVDTPYEDVVRTR